MLKSQSSEELHRTVTAQAAVADDEAASPVASAHRPAWTWGPVAPTPVLFGCKKKLIRANHRVSGNCEIWLPEQVWSRCLGVELRSKVHFIFSTKHIEQLRFGVKTDLKTEG